MLERPMFGLSLEKLLVLAVLALVIFGPNPAARPRCTRARALRTTRKPPDGPRAGSEPGRGSEVGAQNRSDRGQAQRAPGEAAGPAGQLVRDRDELPGGRRLGIGQDQRG